MSHFRLALGLVLLMLLLAGTVAAQGGYDLSWWTVDDGGYAFSTGGIYSLGGTAGQPDAGLLSGEGYTLAGGFWPGGAVAMPEYHIYLPLVARSY